MARIASGVPVDWADVAQAGACRDQSRLAHEGGFLGLSPGADLAAERPALDHVAEP